MGFASTPDAAPPPPAPGRFGRRGAGFRVLTVIAALGLLLSLDYLLARALAGGSGGEWSPLRRAWADWARWLGDGLHLGVAGLALWLVGWSTARRALAAGGRWMVWAVVLAGFWCRVFKILVGRPRPRQWTEHGAWWPHGLTLRSSYDSFPSGHAMTAFALVALLSALAPRAAWWWLALAWFVALGRVVGVDHYLSDVLVGAWLGSLIGTYVRGRWAAEVADEAA